MRTPVNFNLLCYVSRHVSNFYVTSDFVKSIVPFKWIVVFTTYNFEGDNLWHHNLPAMYHMSSALFSSNCSLSSFVILTTCCFWHVIIFARKRLSLYQRLRLFRGVTSFLLRKSIALLLYSIWTDYYPTLTVRARLALFSVRNMHDAKSVNCFRYLLALYPTQ